MLTPTRRSERAFSVIVPPNMNAIPNPQTKIQYVVPTVQSVVPTVQSVVPTVQSVVPTVQSVAPTVQSVAPTVQSVAPTVQSVVPTVQSVVQTVPSVVQTVPSVVQTVPSVVQTVPSVVPQVQNEIPIQNQVAGYASYVPPTVPQTSALLVTPYVMPIGSRLPLVQSHTGTIPPNSNFNNIGGSPYGRISMIQ